ncbi:MAG: glycosyltransferase family 2 protein [Alphaproteobacteria bacterium]|nr:glycosyltransferase family 2 protein [Alphaproteobacteria bacterium]
MSRAVELSIVMPCLNEARTLGECIRSAQSFLATSGVRGEVLVADNGSDDGSQAAARALGARLVDIPERGYGSALLGGIRAARGTFVIMADCDGSYDFARLAPFLRRLRDGADLVMGNRFTGGIAPGAMPALHRYLGNPVLSSLGRVFFRSPCRDFHCGLRGFRRDAILDLDLQAPGMEFASEMVVKATIRGLKIAEVPTTLSPDGRGRPSHLRSWRDGWRHLRFLLLFSPRWLFFYPGFLLFLAGIAGMAWLLPTGRMVGGVGFDIDTLFYASLAVVVGSQSMLFWLFARIYGAREGIVPAGSHYRAVASVFTLEAGLICGGALLLAGIALGGYAVSFWNASDFGALSASRAMRLVIPSGTLILLGFQIASSAFFISVLEIRSTRGPQGSQGAPPREAESKAA